MVDKHEFEVRLGSHSTPADAAKVALGIRSLYAGEHVRHYGTRLMREKLERNPRGAYEDQIGLQCRFPTLLLREGMSIRPIRIIFYQPKDHDPVLITQTLAKFQKIIE